MKATQSELQIINSRLPGTTLLESQVEVLPFRLFDSKVTDRHTYMSIEMMRKLVKDANDGNIAFNGLHRSSTTLPVGRSVEARLVSDGTVSEVLVKMYAITHRPDGTQLEDGKDLADRYNTGAVYACSAGVYVGHYKCSICGNDIRDWEHCDHFPGERYLVDEKPTICTALMTGKDIQDGIAMDCGCYECSAVTAGGVRNASILTETFGHYDKSADIKEFKKAQFENKQISDIVTLTSYNKREEVQMADQDNSLLQKNYELIEAKAKVDVTLATLQGEFTALKSSTDALATTLETTKIEFAKTQTDLTVALVSVEEFTKKVADLEAAAEVTKAEYEAKLETATKVGEEVVAFKTAYISIVEADGVKISREADYSSKSLEELQTLHTEYLAEIAKLPSGQQSSSDVDDTKTVVSAYAGIPDHLFKSN